MMVMYNYILKSIQYPSTGLEMRIKGEEAFPSVLFNFVRLALRESESYRLWKSTKRNDMGFPALLNPQNTIVTNSRVVMFPIKL